MPRISLGLVVTIFLVPFAARASTPCNEPLTHIVTLEMNIGTSGRVAVPAAIGGKPVQMLVDTGAIRSMLSPETEDALGLGRRNLQTRMENFGGTRIASYVQAPGITLGYIQLPPYIFYTQPEGRSSSDINGILAPDILSAFDVDFDFARGKLRFFSQDHCPGAAVYWTHDQHAEIPIEINSLNQILLTVQLDGQDVLTMIDTGSSNSEMSLETAEKLFGFDLSSPLVKHDPQQGKFTPYHYPFKAISMQGVSVSNPDLTLISDDQSKFNTLGWRGVGNYTPRIFLGMNILRQLHFYISYKEKILYATPAEAH